MITGMQVSNKETQETAYAMKVLIGATELHLEGKKLNEEGEKRLTKAVEILDKYGIDDKQLGLYVKSVQESGKKRFTYVTSTLKSEMSL